MKKHFTLLLPLLAFNASAEQPPSLFEQIVQADKKLFDAFNACNVEAMSNIFSKDLEFFHDKSGISNYTVTIKASKANCDRNLGLTRQLVPGTMKVFPIPNYGAIQEAKHEFCHIENGKNDCGTFKFVHIWKLSGDDWTLTRVISYDH